MFGNSEVSYCGDQVRRFDKDRFLLSLTVPAQHREALWALAAYNYEIAKTREVVSDTTLGLIRLQWWRDAVAAIYAGGALPAHEIVRPLAQAVQAYDLPRRFLDDLAYAREFDLEDVAPSSMTGLLHYADITATPLARAAVTISGGAPDHESVQNVATAYALVGLVRAQPYHKAQGRDYMPADLMAASALDQVVKDVAGQAEHLLQRARPVDRYIKAKAKITQLYLKQLKALDYNLYAAGMQAPPLFLPLRVLYAR